MPSLSAILVDLSLLRANERFFVDVWVYFDVRIIGELKSVLQNGVRLYDIGNCRSVSTHPLAVIYRHGYFRRPSNVGYFMNSE